MLRSRWDRNRILDTLESLLQTRGVVVESSALVQEALDATRLGGQGGFADNLLAQVGFANGAREVLTFDETFGKAPRIRLLK